MIVEQRDTIKAGVTHIIVFTLCAVVPDVRNGLNIAYIALITIKEIVLCYSNILFKVGKRLTRCVALLFNFGHTRWFHHSLRVDFKVTIKLIRTE